MEPTIIYVVIYKVINVMIKMLPDFINSVHNAFLCLKFMILQKKINRNPSSPFGIQF